MKKRILGTVSFAVLGLAISSCTSLSNHPALDAVRSMNGAQNPAISGKSFVEAYIEYRGPQEKWAGPVTFLLHVVAKEGDLARVTFTPAFSKDSASESAPATAPIHENAPTVNGRKPASALTLHHALSAEVARTQINQLAAAIQSGDVEFSGCLSPVRVRLLRADGAVVEKQGCRSSDGWPKAASEAVGHFMEFTGQNSGA